MEAKAVHLSNYFGRHGSPHTLIVGSEALKRKAEQFRCESREAFRFHEMAASFFSELGFELQNDPSIILNPYQTTAATYKSNNGLFLHVGFDPLDSNSASVTFGRQWRGGGGWSVLSNKYAALAKRFGIDVPMHYSLGYGDEMPRTMERILDDLRRTLPAVTHRTTLEDLIAIESEAFGARHIAAGRVGPDNLESVEVSDY